MVMDDARLTAARERLEKLRQEAHSAAEETALIAARIEQTTYSAWSRGREVRITIGPDALIQGAEFTEDAMTRSPRSLAAATMDAHDRAIALLRSSVEVAVGAASHSVQGLADTVLSEAEAMLSSAEPRPDDRH
ncbi:MAG: hypothetical protein JF592_15450 [Microbacterium sp.]|uniref:YbaB/EbfC family DNA-binding protein n=1 Tax=Microbacterium natoriense TaxID=284570 RepID=A0AAW8EW89_9MICO|nr:MULTISPECIES: hypothetical protein [Microbacterium]MBW8763953.1 hypothetical protein [Microbacterium sp.]MDQ0647730.1 hypothetical protein [Microbacterium natoriense]